MSNKGEQHPEKSAHPNVQALNDNIKKFEKSYEFVSEKENGKWDSMNLGISIVGHF